MVDEIQEFIQSNTGGGTPSAKFKAVGDKLVGTITRRSIVETTDRKTNDKTKNLVIEVDVTSGLEGGTPLAAGLKAIWIKPSNLLQALSTALKDAGVGAVAVGDKIAVEFIGEEPTNLSPKKIFRVAYQPSVSASAPISTGALSVEDL